MLKEWDENGNDGEGNNVLEDSGTKLKLIDYTFRTVDKMKDDSFNQTEAT